MRSVRLAGSSTGSARSRVNPRAIVGVGLLLLFLAPVATAQRTKPTVDEGVLELLNLAPGMSAADVGAGAGELALLMAERVGAEGRVFANEISESLVDKIDRRIGERGLRNITTVVGEETDPKLPAQVDVIVLKCVYHHLSQPLEFMQNLRRYLKPSGRLVVVAEDITRATEVDPELKRHGDPCVSDPAATAAAIEKAGYAFEKLEHLDRINRKIYVLTLKVKALVTLPFHAGAFRGVYATGARTGAFAPSFSPSVFRGFVEPKCRVSPLQPS